MDLLLEGQKYIQIHKDHMCNCVPSHLQHGNGQVDLHWQEFKIGLCLHVAWIDMRCKLPPFCYGYKRLKGQ